MASVKAGKNENGFTEIINAEKLLNRKIVSKGAYTILMQLKNKSEE